MNDNVPHTPSNRPTEPGKDTESANRTSPRLEDLPDAKAGAHAKEQGEAIKSRSADPGQSSYGGFANEDTRRQAQDLDEKK